MRNTVKFALFACVAAVSFQAASAAQGDAGLAFGNFFGGLKWQPDALNSESEVIGNYQVVVTTDPLSPRVNQTTHIGFKIYNYNQGAYANGESHAETGVNHFTMGIRVFYNDHLVDEFLPGLHKGNSWTVDNTFHHSGNHVLMVDLYDTDKDNKVITCVFNIPVDTAFGPIFQYLLIGAAAAVTGTLLWVKFGIINKSRNR